MSSKNSCFGFFEKEALSEGWPGFTKVGGGLYLYEDKGWYFRRMYNCMVMECPLHQTSQNNWYVPLEIDPANLIIADADLKHYIAYLGKRWALKSNNYIAVMPKSRYLKKVKTAGPEWVTDHLIYDPENKTVLKEKTESKCVIRLVLSSLKT